MSDLPNPILGNNSIRDLLAQLLRTRNVIRVQRGIEEIAHI